ncbi:MAG TPA: bifunctional alpha,alpha-trehalose-phosphate synthase (UDP-forming)/trehalose-phosphatase [Cyclobacteriaceae bacterium]|nr:bifunctional alpha,alpha-trehalose-phosphate synthase (UDP-forming)/trehalose-phosphatase [Cyclobacteriaceae bacterium]
MFGPFLAAERAMDKVNNSRLIVVSNRLPLKITKQDGKTVFSEADGGLVSALKSYFEKSPESQFPEKYWVGAADFPEKKWKKASSGGKLSSSYTIEPIFFEEKVFSKYYNGFCNATIWPLFHYFPSITDFEDDTFNAYEEVNRVFRDKILSFVKPGDTVWIHDYQLMLLPGMIREAMPELTIGFFLHIPFPSYEIFRLLHRDWKKKIIDGLLGADLIGFHTGEYLQHFLKTTTMVSGLDHRYREVFNKKGIVKADLFPISIDFEKFADTRDNPGIIAHKQSIRERFGEAKIIFSVDRLDYTKGVTHRLSGFAKFLEMFPEWRGKVVFIMVVVPSRQIVSKYNERKKMIEEQVGRINGKFSTIEWQPIIYRYSQLAFEELSALYQSAAVALITPLRDGMNLVAKEYIASRIDNDGVLILSELAGAANELGEAMLVNPTDKVEVARKINAALTSSPEEQKQAMVVMRRRIKENDVVAWVSRYFHELKDIKGRQHELGIKMIDEDTSTWIMESYQQANKKLLFLDYDGTLVPIAALPGNAHPSAELLSLLKTLSNDPSTEVVIISGRNFQILEKWLGHLSIHLVAEHGASLRLKGENWQHYTDIDSSWKNLIKSTFELYAQRAPGSFIEEKDHTIAWHYRGVDEELGFIRSRELLDSLYHLVRNTHLNVLDGHKVIEVRAAGIDKGIATGKIMERFPSDFILAIGDDKTDEDIFNVLKGKGVTIKVGNDLTAAEFNVRNQREAFRLLDKLSMNLVSK